MNKELYCYEELSVDLPCPFTFESPALYLSGSSTEDIDYQVNSDGYGDTDSSVSDVYITWSTSSEEDYEDEEPRVTRGVCCHCGGGDRDIITNYVVHLPFTICQPCAINEFRLLSFVWKNTEPIPIYLSRLRNFMNKDL